MTFLYSTYTLLPMNNQTPPSIHGFQRKLQKIVELANALEKTPAKFGTNEFLSGAEIHLVEMVGDHEGISLTCVAELIGVTKGAVSQTLKKTEKKGLIKKEEARENLSKYRLSLTTKGKVAYFSHKEWHETMDGGFRNYIDNLGDGQVLTIDEFLTMVIRFLQSGINRKR